MKPIMIDENTWRYYWRTTPVGIHNAVIQSIDMLDGCDGRRPCTRVVWYIPSLKMRYAYVFAKSRSIVSKSAEFFRMLEKAYGRKWKSFDELIGKKFLITVVVAPHWDEGEQKFQKITNIEKEDNNYV